jgi:hypothetical protein
MVRRRNNAPRISNTIVRRRRLTKSIIAEETLRGRVPVSTIRQQMSSPRW